MVTTPQVVVDWNQGLIPPAHNENIAMALPWHVAAGGLRGPLCEVID